MDTVDEVTMESDDWRTPIQRQRIVNKIMDDTLKTHLPFTGNERLEELNKIAEMVEHEIFTCATTQSEYSRKICFMMLTMETRLQTPMMSIGKPNGGDWQAQVYQKIQAMKDLYLQNQIVEDWQEEVYQKIQAMKDLYLSDLNDMHQKVLSKLQQLDSLPQQPQDLKIEKLEICKKMLECYMYLLQPLSME